MADPQETLEAVERDGVRFTGAFRPHEREFLGSQFGHCSLRLVARSALDPALALVRWEATPATAGGPSPLRAAPREATYVLHTASAAAGERDGGSRWPGMRLDRVEGTAELAARFPGHFPGVAVGLDWRDRLRRAVQDVRPALMLAVATVWVLAVVWACRPFG